MMCGVTETDRLENNLKVEKCCTIKRAPKRAVDYDGDRRNFEGKFNPNISGFLAFGTPL